MKNFLFTLTLSSISVLAFSQTFSGSLTGQKYTYSVLKSVTSTLHDEEYPTIGSFNSGGYYDDEDFPKNILSITPFSYVLRTWTDSNNIEFGFQYERILGNKVSVFLPLSMGLQHKSFFVNPGVKFYPGGQGVFRYAFGMQFVAGSEKYMIEHLDSNYNSVFTPTKVFQMGFMINNSLNVTISRRFYIGADLGLGLILYNSPKKEIDGLGFFILGPIMLVDPCLMGGIHTGIRF